MKTHPRYTQTTAFTLLELMITISVIALLAAVLLPALAKPQRRSSKINCVNNLKQVALSFRLWAGDNGDKYPAYVSVTNGGVMELIAGGGVAPIFNVMSNELGTPKLVVCPADSERIAATNFATMSDTNVSYFVCLTATDESNPQLWLTGDRNITNGLATVRGVLNVPTNSPVGWTKKLHEAKGNLALADGSVQQLTSSALLRSLRTQTNAALQLALPE